MESSDNAMDKHVYIIEVVVKLFKSYTLWIDAGLIALIKIITSAMPSYTVSPADIKMWVEIMGGVMVIIYTALRCISVYRDIKAKK